MTVDTPSQSSPPQQWRGPCVCATGPATQRGKKGKKMVEMMDKLMKAPANEKEVREILMLENVVEVFDGECLKHTHTHTHTHTNTHIHTCTHQHQKQSKKNAP